MRTKVVITVDVEPSIAGAFHDPARYTPRLHEPVAGEIAGKSEALGFLVETLASHGLTATFFVETVHVNYFPEQLMGTYARQLGTAGQDVQLHLHPCWLGFGADPVSDHCSELGENRLVELMIAGRALIERWTGRMPIALRTGNFSVSAGTYRAMDAAGLRIASNICVAVAPPADEALSFTGGVQSIEGIIEVPVTCFKDLGPVGRGAWRPLQITACSFEEQRDTLSTLQATGGKVAVIVTHPFEFLKWSGSDFSALRPNRLVQGRFKRLCRFLAGETDRFEVVPIARLIDDGIHPEPAIPLNGRALASLWRAAENAVNDRLPF